MIRSRYVKHIRRLLLPGEVIEFTTQQRRIVPGGSILTPRIIVGTNTRIIIFKRQILGIAEDFDVIPYNRVTHVKLEDGIFSSSVVMDLEGTVTQNPLNTRGSIDVTGLRHDEAAELIKFLDKVLMEEEMGEHLWKTKEGRGSERREITEITCKTCGTKNDITFNYCEHCGAHL